jgi:hypothetical protein
MWTEDSRRKLGLVWLGGTDAGRLGHSQLGYRCLEPRQKTVRNSRIYLMGTCPSLWKWPKLWHDRGAVGGQVEREERIEVGWSRWG